jgi:hypothetical protein
MTENRKTARTPFERFVLYTTPAGLFEGTIMDYSDGGVAIRNNRAKHKVGEDVIIALPYKQADIKRKGYIAWVRGNFFGVEFKALKRRREWI